MEPHSTSQFIALPRLSGKSIFRFTAALSLSLSLALVAGSRAQSGTFNPNYPQPLSSDLPHDVNTTGVTSLGEARRAFDIDSWQTFIALNWPLDAQGKPAEKLGDHGDPAWMQFKESTDVYLPNGATPAPWGSARQLLASIAGAPANARILSLTNKAPSKMINSAEEDLQAFSRYPLVDWNNNVVHYEILMNKDEFDYTVTNELYNLDGQVKFATNHNTLTFPSGAAKGAVGAMEIKLAWKTLDTEHDHAERYLHMPAYILNADGTRVRREVGLVGMHIAHKTVTAPQWIWSTFEQVDNLAVDELATADGKPLNLKPSFYNPDQQTIPVNIARFGPDKKTQLPTQVQRVIPIPESTQALTRQLQGLLRDQKSVLQYYELVGTQWPTPPTSAPPTTPGPGTAPGSIANKAGGNPQPVFLTNMTLETYFQTGNQPASSLEEGNVVDNTPSFGTESCIGCHSSAGFATGFTVDGKGNKEAVTTPQLTGDFSWLPAQKAQWKK